MAELYVCWSALLISSFHLMLCAEVLGGAQKNYHSGPEAAAFRKACLQGWPSAGVWELGLWEELGSQN